MIDWTSLLRAALALGIQPEAFWRLSLREWIAVTSREDGTGLSRARLNDLLRQYPDRDEEMKYNDRI